MIGIQVLGPLEVTVDGVPVGVGGPRQRCVLARLIAARGRVVSADRLIEDLYAGEAPPKALAAVQSYVSHLRRALEPGRAAWGRDASRSAHGRPANSWNASPRQHASAVRRSRSSPACRGLTWRRPGWMNCA